MTGRHLPDDTASRPAPVDRRRAPRLPRTLNVLPAAILLALLCSLVPVARGLADFDAGLKAYQAGEFRAAFEEWIDLARDGDPAAMRNVGHLYRWGHGVQQDLPTAADWYRRAAETGLDRAQANLAMMYLEGQGVPADPAQAAYWFSQAAIQGHTVAQFNLAQLYQQGRGVQRNEGLALGWLQRAAKAGHPGALAQLGALVAEPPPPTPGLQRKDAPPGSDAPPAVPATPAPPRLDPASGESLETPATGSAPEILDRLAGVFGSDKPAEPEPAPPPRRDAESGTASVQPVRSPPPPAAPPADGSDGPAAAGDRSDAEQWVLALIEDAVTEEPAQADAAPALPRATAAPSSPAPAASAVAGTAASQSLPPARKPAAAPLPPIDPGDEAVAAMRLYDEGRYDAMRGNLAPMAEAGTGRAQYLLGWLYEQGLGGPADPALAYYWYIRASTGGNLQARRALEDLQRRIDPAVRSRAEALLRTRGRSGNGG
ncbi:MAG: SEL1-like repeat protein [Sneathiellaceae bacterium]